MVEATQNSILRISDNNVLRLIDLYEAEPCLWKTTDEDYRLRGKRAEAAERIAKKLRIKHFEAKHVVIKFKNLRNSYCQELKKIRKSLDSAAQGEDEVYRPRVFWFAKMDSFLRPHLQPARTEMYLYPPLDGSEMSCDDEDTKTDEDTLPEVIVVPGNVAVADDGGGVVLAVADDNVVVTEDWVQFPNQETIVVPEKLAIDANADATVQQERNDDAPLNKPAIERKPIRRKPISKLNVQHCCIEKGMSGQMLRTIAVYLEQLNKPHVDGFDSFGKYVATLLRALPAAHALALQPRIVQLLTSAAAVGVSDAHVSQSDENI